MLAGSERPAAVDVDLALSQHLLPKAGFFTCSVSQSQVKNPGKNRLKQSSLAAFLFLSPNLTQALASGTQLWNVFMYITTSEPAALK